MIVNGKQIAAEILARTKVRAERLERPPLVVALSAEETLATKSYLKIKAARAADAGCDFHVRPYPAEYDDATAVIIQLPLPEGIDTQVACDTLPIGKDADVLSRAARAKFEAGDAEALLPPVVGAIKKILESASVSVVGKRAVVIGAGFLVGAPAATWLRQQGARVEVFTVESKPEDLVAALRAADVIVSGAGSPHLIKPDMVKDGVVLIDAGTSESNGVIVGDADPECASKCSLFTPVPGGVGPIAVACLFENAVMLAQSKNT